MGDQEIHGSYSLGTAAGETQEETPGILTVGLPTHNAAGIDSQIQRR